MVFWCCFYASGIIGLLVAYGLLQERIMTIEYSGQLFEDSVFLVLANRLFAVVLSLALAKYHEEPLANKAPLWKYAIVSLSNVYASTCQYESLKYISFAVQMLGKSFKMIPVMLWGIAISGKKYGPMDWVVAAVVTGGVTEFLMTGPTESSTDTANNFTGFLWMFGYLALDGLTSTMQEKLFKEHKVTKFNQMMWVNTISSAVSLITLVASGTLGSAVSFWASHPSFMWDSTLLSLCSASSQWFIYSMVKEFGALAFAATMNVRQMISIIVSYVTYGHFITWLQIVGLFFVFAALLYKSFAALAAPKGEKAPLMNPENKAPPEAAEADGAGKTEAEKNV